MAQPEKSRERDEHVEPLFAGLSRAHDQGDEEAALEQHASTDGAAPRDLWHDSRRAFAPQGEPKPERAEDEPSTGRLLLKALFLLVLLVAAGAFVYLTFGV